MFFPFGIAIDVSAYAVGRQTMSCPMFLFLVILMSWYLHLWSLDVYVEMTEVK